MLSLCALTVSARGVMQVLKRVDLRDDPCGTPQMIFPGFEVKSGIRILWVLLVRKEAIHLRASPWISRWLVCLAGCDDRLCRTRQTGPRG